MCRYHHTAEAGTQPANYRLIQVGILLLCSFLLPATAHALGIKEPVLKSYIHEPLRIEIPLILTRTEKNTDIVIHQIVGKNRHIREWVPDLKFVLVSDFEDNLTIIASTRTPVTEPIVHIVISIDTGLNWIQREMSFLLDPKPVQRLAAERARDVKPGVVLRPSEARMRRSESIRLEAKPAVEEGNRYTVRTGDSLSLIAQNFRHSREITLQQAMVAIFRANPGAFINEDVNKIKSYYKITIPDEIQMKQLSSAEARTIFSQLLAGIPIPVPQQPAPQPLPTPQVPPEVVDIPEDKPAIVVQTDIDPVIPDTVVEDQIIPIEEEPAPAASTVADDEYHLTLTPENVKVPDMTIRENAGTVVFEGAETTVSKATTPSPEIKTAMRAAVTEMEDQIVTLRQEVKKLRQSLQGRENLLALRSESRLRSLPVEKVADKAVRSPPAAKGADAEEQKTTVAELEVSSPKQAESGFDFLRLFIEILTLGAAGAFIGYLIAIKRKREDKGELEFPTTVKGFREFITPARSEDNRERPEAEEPVSDLARGIRKSSKVVRPRPDDVRTFMRSSGKQQQGINVTEEAYDDAIDFTHAETAPEATPDTTQGHPEEKINPEYLLQEANLSIAFADLGNAYHLLTQLVNNDPGNPEYRLVILKVLKDLLKEEEFIYHANHLARITAKSFATPWQQAHELGMQFLPDHPLFSTPAAKPPPVAVPPVEPESPVAEADTEASTGANNLSFAAQKTAVLEVGDALAEYEQRMQEKQQPASPPKATGSENEEEAVIDLDELLDDGGTNETGHKKPFHLNLDEPAVSANGTADSTVTMDEGAQLRTDDVDHILEFDTGEIIDEPTKNPVGETNISVKELKPVGNIIEFDSSPDVTNSVETREEMAKELADHLTPETLASMAEYAAIEGISLDTDLLNMAERLKDYKEEDNNEDEQNTIEETVITKQD